MISNVEMRRTFERTLIKGLPVLDTLPDCTPQAQSVWERRIELDYELAAAPTLSADGRRMNTFCLGSDPEFVFHAGGSHKVTANELGLRPGLAVGCDQNLRLAELRGFPTRSAVEHVAGIMASLRWMYRVYPDTRRYMWRAGANFDRDGIGGHIHFGRKRPTRAQEVLGLDGLTSVMRYLEFFNNKEWDKRIGGDNHNQRYGDYGDIRQQIHGYEYRTLPSWLCTPNKAFFMLTIAKLAVLDPDLVAGWRARVFTQPNEAHKALFMLARYHAGRDDDAWILKHVIAREKAGVGRGWNRAVDDFKPFWGMPAGTPVAHEPESKIIPAVIAPDPTEVKEIADLLVGQKPLGFREVNPTFQSKLPARYQWLYAMNIENIQRAGVGDLMHNLVGHKDFQINLRMHNRTVISEDMWNLLSAEDKIRTRNLFGPGMEIAYGANKTIYINHTFLGVKYLTAVRNFLIHSKTFPIWTINSVKEDSFKEWAKVHLEKAVKKTLPMERNL